MTPLRVAAAAMLLVASPTGAATLVREFQYPAQRLEARWRGDTVAVAYRGALREVA